MWIITDTHFQHDNIIHYCQRPKDHGARVIKSWKRRVKPGDTIIHLGDCVMGGKEKVTAWYENVFPTLPGRKILIKGNHDWSKQKLMKYWDEVVGYYVVDYKGLKVLLTHCPNYTIKVDGRKFDLNVHGHQHNSVGPNPGPPRNILFALEYSGYMVQPFETWLARRIKERERLGKWIMKSS